MSKYEIDLGESNREQVASIKAIVDTQYLTWGIILHERTPPGVAFQDSRAELEEASLSRRVQDPRLGILHLTFRRPTLGTGHTGKPDDRTPACAHCEHGRRENS